jgi:hypothetical protein
VIRILIPFGLYTEARIALLRRVVPLKSVSAYECLKGIRRESAFLEGFLESEEKMRRLACRLTDYPDLIRVTVDDIATFVMDEEYVDPYSDLPPAC